MCLSIPIKSLGSVLKMFRGIRSTSAPVTEHQRCMELWPVAQFIAIHSRCRRDAIVAHALHWELSRACATKSAGTTAHNINNQHNIARYEC